MKRLKKTLAAALSLVLLLTALTSCFPFLPSFDDPEPDPDPSDTNAQQVQQAFDQFLEREFLGYVTQDTYTLHSTLRYPESYGLGGMPATWGDLSVYPSQQQLDEGQQIIAEFRSFDRSLLTSEQQRAYDIYAYELELYDISLETLFYYDPFSGSSGVHAMMPVVMAEYDFFDKQDVEDYLVLVETYDDLFGLYLEHELERSRRGLFLADWVVDDVIEGCEAFMQNTTDNIFITSFNSRIDDLEGLTAAEKRTYKEENEKLFNSVILPTYETIIREMQKLKGTGVNNGGLANFDLGKDYYSYMLRSMGSSMTPEELIKLSDNMFAELYREMIGIVTANPDIYDIVESSVTPKMTGEEVMEYLSEACKEDFPAIPGNIEYSLTPIDDSIKDTVSPAFYFVPRIDDYTKNSIYFNADYFTTDQDYMFTTLAHEGYPGHLLQNCIMMSSPTISDWQKTLSYSAYSEGWASYTERYVYKYVDVDEDVARYLQITSDLDLLLFLRMDLGVNYEGWTQQNLKDHVIDMMFGYDLYDAEFYEWFYEFCVADPLRNVPYVLGLLEINENKEYYEQALGGGFSDYEFHEELLKYGEVPFELLWQWVDESLLGAARAA